jgi:hypothetical protein
MNGGAGVHRAQHSVTGGGGGGRTSAVVPATRQMSRRLCRASPLPRPPATAPESGLQPRRAPFSWPDGSQMCPVEGETRPCLVHPENQKVSKIILWHLYETLNVDENKN